MTPGIQPDTTAPVSRAAAAIAALKKRIAAQHASGAPGAQTCGLATDLCDEVVRDVWQGILAALPRSAHRPEALMDLLDDWLKRQGRKTPLLGCVLIGGKSKRMGRPKHLIVERGKTWLERTVALLEQVCRRLVIAGAGEVPASLARHVRLPDVPDAEGPLSGILAAMRWAPHASWLVVACDLSDLSLEALQWLLSTRAPGVWATSPRLTGSARVEPLLAHYDFRARALLEEIAAEGDFRLHRVVARSRVITPSPPPELTLAWRNVNTETMLKSHPL